MRTVGQKNDSNIVSILSSVRRRKTRTCLVNQFAVFGQDCCYALLTRITISHCIPDKGEILVVIPMTIEPLQEPGHFFRSRRVLCGPMRTLFHIFLCQSHMDVFESERMDIFLYCFWLSA